MTNSLPAAQKFLAEFWQKKPLLARGALKQFSSVLDRARMLQLACRDDVESRVVIGSRHSWRVEREQRLLLPEFREKFLRRG